MTTKLNTGDQNSQILFEKKENLNEDFVNQANNYLINNNDEADDV